MFDLTTSTGVDEPSECSQKWREHILIASTDIKNDSYDEKKDESCVNTTKSPRMLKLVCTFLIIMVAILSTILGIFIHKMVSISIHA